MYTVNPICVPWFLCACLIAFFVFVVVVVVVVVFFLFFWGGGGGVCLGTRRKIRVMTFYYNTAGKKRCS